MNQIIALVVFCRSRFDLRTPGQIEYVIGFAFQIATFYNLENVRDLSTEFWFCGESPGSMSILSTTSSHKQVNSFLLLVFFDNFNQSNCVNFSCL